MRIITLNLNGIRSAADKGFFAWFLRQQVDVVNMQDLARTPKDLKNWRASQTHSGFLPEERAWLSWVLDELGWVDVFRRLNPDVEQYTWWSYRGQAWAKNMGWRIDYQIATPGIAARAQRADIYTAQRFSDHAPLLIDCDYAC